VAIHISPYLSFKMALTELDNNPSREVSEVNLIWDGCADETFASIIKHMKR